MNSGSQEPPPSGRFPLVLAKGQRLLGAEPAQHIFEHPRDIVIVVIVRKAATEGDRAGRKDCAITDRLKIDDLGTDQRLWPLTVNRRHVSEQFLRHDYKESPRASGEGWHTDVSWDQEPPMGSILYIRQSPPIGGDTLFASMYAAYEALSDRMKTYLEGLTAIHNGEHYRGQYANYGIADKPSYPRAEHPVVRTHPVTGKKGLYVNKGFTRRILGVSRDESEGILNYLYDHMANPLFQCRFRWRENSIAFWDNRCVQHHAMWDYWPHTRSGHRVTVKGERPFYRPEALPG